MTLSIPSLERPGAEREAREPEAVGAAREEASLRDWIVAFYLEHNPEKLGGVDSLLAKYAGRENELVRQLERKYEGRRGSAAGEGASNPFEDDDDDDDLGVCEGAPILDEGARTAHKLRLTREALKACFEENGRLQRAIVASSELACGLADARAELDDVGAAAVERQQELDHARREQARLFEENGKFARENDDLRAALVDARAAARATRANHCAELDRDALGAASDAALAHLFDACAATLPAVADERKRRLDAARAATLCVDCGERPRTKMAAVCAHLAFCHGCQPSGASMCPLCDAVVLADQWVHVRQV